MDTQNTVIIIMGTPKGTPKFWETPKSQIQSVEVSGEGGLAFLPNPHTRMMNFPGFQRGGDIGVYRVQGLGM